MAEHHPSGSGPRSREARLLKGVFSSQEVLRHTVAGVVRKTVNKKFWYVTQLDENTYEVQGLGANYLPTGRKRMMSEDDLLAKYSPEIDVYHKRVRPALEELNQYLQRGDAHRVKGESYSAEVEYGLALKVDEENVRATFGLGMTYLKRENVKKGLDVFEKLLKMEAPFWPEHKHMFNDFGIALRKNRMYEQALDFYFRAKDLDSDDEHLFFNIARTYFEMGNWDRCVDYLTQCLTMNRGVAEAQRFCAYLIRLDEEDRIPEDEDEFGMNESAHLVGKDVLDRMAAAAGLSVVRVSELRSKARERVLREVEKAREEKQRRQVRFDLKK